MEPIAIGSQVPGRFPAREKENTNMNSCDPLLARSQEANPGKEITQLSSINIKRISNGQRVPSTILK